jgi:hypothetical protein
MVVVIIVFLLGIYNWTLVEEDLLVEIGRLSLVFLLSNDAKLAQIFTY